MSRPVLRIVFAGAVGLVFGFQNWRLANYGFSLSLSWREAFPIMLIHLLLGLTIGLVASGKHYWLRGISLGVIFSLPIAFGAIQLGLSWVPCGLAALVSGSVGGLLIALITQAVFPQSGFRADHQFRLRHR